MDLKLIVLGDLDILSDYDVLDDSNVSLSMRTAKKCRDNPEANFIDHCLKTRNILILVLTKKLFL